MTNNIYPPDHLLRKWESLIIDEEQNVDVVLYEAFQAGADQELEACCEWVSENVYRNHPFSSHELRTTRRPKPPSLKEQALDRCNDYIDPDGIIRRALESLPD